MTQPTFEDRLLSELRRVVAERDEAAAAAPADAAPAAPHRRRRAPLALAGGMVAAATAAIALFATTGDRTPSAYAVSPRDDGGVTVLIRSLRDADGLERSLRAAGIPADVTYAPAAAGCGATLPATAEPQSTVERDGKAGGAASGALPRAIPVRPSAGATRRHGTVVPAGTPHGTTSVRHTDEGVEFSITPNIVRAGERVAIRTTDGEMASLSMAVGTVADAPPACAPEGQPAP